MTSQLSKFVPGMKVAALVPYQKKTAPPEWIVCVLVSFDEERGECTVKDDVPETRKQSEWTIPATRCLPFPPSPEEMSKRKFEINEEKSEIGLLCYILPQYVLLVSFSSYVMSIPPNGTTLQLAFKGDNAIVPTPLDKILQLPKTEIIGEPRRSPSDEQEPPAKVARAEPEELPEDDQHEEEEAEKEEEEYKEE
ncbi:hypothetical protein RCL1_001496 [Eukaryota sp. TZLM3-RCL]